MIVPIHGHLKKRPSLRYKFLDDKPENISLFNVSASPYII